MNELQHNIQQSVTKTGLRKIKNILDALEHETKRNKEEVKIITDIVLGISVLALVIFVFNVT